jgi:alkanesulfonate monooxygenase SsuD/methylene tetrahydromethanopterin reductase-like flavin-dependent oxidoreductase (luciferase family)
MTTPIAPSTPRLPLPVGLSLPTWPRVDRSYATWPEIRTLALEAEAMGVDTLWVADHLQRDLATGERIGFWESWTIVTALAEATSRVRVGPYVACTGFRNPALLAKMAVTLDEVSGGRLVLALGSGVPERDTGWRAFGYETERPVRRYGEAAEVITRLLREPSLTFAGEVFRTQDAQLLPRSAGRQPVPVWCSGVGEATLRVAARWGDAVDVNLPLCGPVDLDRALEARDRACAAVGRDPSTLALSGWTRLVLDENGAALARAGTLAGSPAEVAAVVRGFADAGLAHLTCYVGAPGDPSRLPALTPETLRRFGIVLAAIRAG